VFAKHWFVGAALFENTTIFTYYVERMARFIISENTTIFTYMVFDFKSGEIRNPPSRGGGAQSMERSSLHLLRLVVSCRKLSAEIYPPQTQTIVAMATSTEPEFAPRQRALQARNPSAKLLWSPATAARIGEILSQRLLAIGVYGVSVDIDEELSRPPHWRRSISPFFESFQRSGVRIDGAEKLQWP
jgi:hypothetical protein